MALAITRGFSQEIERKIIGFAGHVRVDSIQDAPLEDAERIQNELLQIERVVSATPAIQELALFRSDASIDGFVLWGSPTMPPFIAENLASGEASFRADSLNRPGIVLSAAIARQLGASLGERITVFSMRSLDGEQTLFGRQRPSIKQFHVEGIYDTGFVDFDEQFAFADIASVRTLLEYGEDEVTAFDVRVDDVSRVDDVAQEVESRLGFPVWARTVYQEYRNLFAWVNLQESIIPLILTIIVLVAAFNIVSTLLMLSLEKTRDIGVLGSLGASSKDVRRLFLWIGAIIAGTGILLGEGLALVLAGLQQSYGIIPLPADTYYMDTAPIALAWTDFAVVAVATFVLCLLSAYVPARVASRVDPVRAIRFGS